MSWFKPRKPAPQLPPRLSPEEARIASWYHYTEAQWRAMPHYVLAGLRDGYYQAHGMAS